MMLGTYIAEIIMLKYKVLVLGIVFHLVLGSEGQTCQTTTEIGNFCGNRLNTNEAESSEHCCWMCLINDLCYAWELVKHSKLCFLKSGFSPNTTALTSGLRSEVCKLSHKGEDIVGQ